MNSIAKNNTKDKQVKLCQFCKLYLTGNRVKRSYYEARLRGIETVLRDEVQS